MIKEFTWTWICPMVMIISVIMILLLSFFDYFYTYNRLAIRWKIHSSLVITSWLTFYCSLVYPWLMIEEIIKSNESYLISANLFLITISLLSPLCVWTLLSRYMSFITPLTLIIESILVTSLIMMLCSNSTSIVILSLFLAYSILIFFLYSIYVEFHTRRLNEYTESV